MEQIQKRNIWTKKIEIEKIDDDYFIIFDDTEKKEIIDLLFITKQEVEDFIKSKFTKKEIKTNSLDSKI